MHKDFYGYQKGNVETKYIIEYIDDEKTWKKFLKANEKNSSFEPWELFTVREYDNITEAIRFFIIKGSHEGNYIIQMTENIYYNDELILENPVEFPDDLYTLMAQNINEDMRKRLIKCEKEYNSLQQLTEQYDGFIKKYHAEESFRKWKEER